MNREVCNIAPVFSCLSSKISSLLLPHTDLLRRAAVEIRLRINRPLAVVFSDETMFLTESGCFSLNPQNAYIVTESEINDSFSRICEYSVYSKQGELVNGFVTVRGGHRAGICGTGVYSGATPLNVRCPSSINLRIARQIIGCSKPLFSLFKPNLPGFLLCGEPSSGKTTVLRDLARELSWNQRKCVALIDERGELAAALNGVPQYDVGLCDVFDGYKKSHAMTLALRTMSPDYIICDELGEDDVQGVLELFNSGVRVIASAHAVSAAEILRHATLSKLFNSGVFEAAVFLKSRRDAGKIESAVKAGDLLAA